MKLIGNEDMMGQLNVSITSAIAENRSLPHILLSGAAGCGKTSTARYIAETTKCDLLEIAPENVKIRKDVFEIGKALNRTGWSKHGDKIGTIRPTIVFMDEIHRLPITGQEHFGLLMENWVIPVNEKEIKINFNSEFKESKAARVRWCPRFTLIGATTNDGLLSKPFKDRFKIKFIFSTYTEEESIEIVKVHAERLEIAITDNACKEISKRGRGVPRIIVSLIERCRDSAIYNNLKTITSIVALATFAVMKIDETGLTTTDINIMKALYTSETPVGLDNIAIITNESSKTILETIEPHLIQQGFITRSPRGRVLTDKGRIYLIENNYIKCESREDDWEDIPVTYKRRL